MATEVAEPEPLTLSPSDVVKRTGIPRSSVYALVRDGVIPRLDGYRSAYRIPRWAVDAYVATGDWRHPDWRPVPPGNPEPDDSDTEQPAATVTPIRPDAS